MGALSSESRGRRLVLRWTAPRGLTAMALFLALAVLIEYLVVRIFTSLGLNDGNLLSFAVPSTGLSVTISPLFHLIPIGVIAVLVSSWTYLTGHVAVVPPKAKPTERPARGRERPGGPRRRFSRVIGGRFRRVGRALRSFNRRVSAALLRVRGVSYLLRRLHFARAAVQSSASVLTSFLMIILLLCALGYPQWVHNGVAGVYVGNSLLLGLVLRVTGWAHAAVRALPPVRGLLQAINDALIAAAPGFRNALVGRGRPVVEAMASLDPVARYVICQNVAAWASAMSALAYGHYRSRLYRRRRPR